VSLDCVIYAVHFTAFCLGGPFFPGHGVYQLVLRWVYAIGPLKKPRFETKFPLNT